VRMHSRGTLPKVDVGSALHRGQRAKLDGPKLGDVR
jgi:hypothetical protein